MGWRSLLGGSPFANSMAVMPRDHMSAYGVRGRGGSDAGSEGFSAMSLRFVFQFMIYLFW